MNTHARLSPSARGRWGNCPGSIRVIEAMQLPEGESSPSAKDGTHSHTLLEFCIKNTKHPSNCIGEVFTDHEGQFSVDKARADRVKIVTDYVDGRIAELGEQTVVVGFESHVSPSTLVGRDDMDGTIDVSLETPLFFELIDLKDGMNPVDAKDNLQLEQYAVAVMAERLAKGIYTTVNIRLTIVQPKLAIKGLEPISSWDLTVEELFNRLPTMISQAGATDHPDAPLVPGETQCRYCPAAGSCKPHQDWVLQQSGVKFDPTQVNDLVQEALNRDNEEVTDKKLAEIILAAPLLRKMIENAEAEALRRLKAGSLIEGLKIVRGSAGSRKWKVPEEEVEKRLKGFKIPQSAIYKKELVTAAKVLNGFTWTDREGTKYALTENQIELLNTDYVTKTEGHLTVVPADDKRPAVLFGAPEGMFSGTDQAAGLPDWLKL